MSQLGFCPASTTIAQPPSSAPINVPSRSPNADGPDLGPRRDAAVRLAAERALAQGEARPRRSAIADLHPTATGEPVLAGLHEPALRQDRAVDGPADRGGHRGVEVAVLGGPGAGRRGSRVGRRLVRRLGRCRRRSARRWAPRTAPRSRAPRTRRRRPTRSAPRSSRAPACPRRSMSARRPSASPTRPRACRTWPPHRRPRRGRPRRRAGGSKGTDAGRNDRVPARSIDVESSRGA